MEPLTAPCIIEQIQENESKKEMIPPALAAQLGGSLADWFVEPYLEKQVSNDVYPYV